MKQIKNAMFAIAGSLLFVAVATVSCSKSSPTTTAPTPTVSGINPTTDTVGKTVSVTISGTNLAGASVSTTATGVTVSGVTATSTSITATIALATSVTPGSITLTVTTTAGSTTTTITAVAAGTTLYQTPDGHTNSNQIATSNLIGYWPFNGSISDSLYGNLPTLKGGTYSFVTGRIGQAVSITNGFFTYPFGSTAAGTETNIYNSSDTLQNGFTVSLWAQLPDTSLFTNLFSLNVPQVANWPQLGIDYRKHDGTNFIDLDGGLSNVDGSGTHPSYASAFGPSVNDSLSWAFITMVYDTTGQSVGGQTLVYYFNGVKVGTSVILGAAGADVFPIPESLLELTPNYATIGAPEGEGTTPGDASNAIPGFMSSNITAVIDDVRFFNTTLTPTQVNDLFLLGTHGQ